MTWEAHMRGQAMVNISAAKTFTAMVSVATLGVAISFGTGTALAQDKNVTEDQIVRALAPEKKPLTRGLSVGPQQTADPAVSAAEGKFVQKIRGRSTRSLSASEREEIAAIKRYLVDKYGINGTDLVTVGYGKSKLKDPNQPMAEVNRRVQVVNMENKATASNAAK